MTPEEKLLQRLDHLGDRSLLQNSINPQPAARIAQLLSHLKIELATVQAAILTLRELGHEAAIAELLSALLTPT